MKFKGGAVWPYMVLSIALLGAISFGWYQTRMANQLALDAENKYLSAFHKLKWTSENIEERTARIMATNDSRMQESLLADLRVFSAQAVEHMSVLPLMTLNTPQITSFLNTLRKTSDEMHYSLTMGDPLTEEEWSKLAALRTQAVHFEDQLSSLLGLVGNNHIRWRDTVRVTGMAQDGAATTPITKAVMALNDALSAPPGEGGALAPQQGPMAPPKMDLGPRVDEQAAAQAAQRFVDLPLTGPPILTATTDPDDETHELALYFLDATKANGTPQNFGISVHGGHVIFMIDGREVKQRRLTKDQLVERARTMLANRGYPDLRFLSAIDNAGTLVMDWAPMQNGIAIHTEIIKISLAMDDGELVGFNARNHWVNRHERKYGQPTLSSAEAKQRIAPRLSVVDEPTLAVIANRMNNEKLVWLVKAQMEEIRYHIFIDANTGAEVSVTRVSGGDPAPPLNQG